ncbi:hypothetical protein BGZ73_002770 [Actinomortierella ambigua]|nr:hypothetical protein BGZ73_002770 [Actinomortierella ambigua]
MGQKKTSKRDDGPEELHGEEEVKATNKVAKKTRVSTATDDRRSKTLGHAARLPPIVWVHDTKYSWWPGKLKPYPPADDYATVSRFGSVRPKTVTVKCTEDFVLPFEHTRKEGFREHGTQSSYSVAFQKAFKDACQAQLQEDDDLPNLDDVLDHINTALPIAKDIVATKTNTSNLAARPPTAAAVIHTPDPSLTIPGEGIFALSERVYYPARILEFNDKTGKYKVEFATGHQHTIERTKFYTKYEQKFLTCPLGTLRRPEINENYENEKLRQHVHDLFPALHEIVRGAPDKANRSRDFFKGAKDRIALAQKVGPGAFDAQEYAFIRRLLVAQFMPSINTKRRKTLNGSSQSSSSFSRRSQQATAKAEATAAAANTPLEGPDAVTKGLSDQRRLLFVTDVLLPETVTRLTMVHRGISYEDAHQLVQDCVRDESKDISWVEDIYSARESFLEGRSFRGTAK